VGVVGKVGSGKSSLLAAITAEMRRKDGQVSRSDFQYGMVRGRHPLYFLSPFLCRSVWLTFLMDLV
jgi:ATPase subunit of ABC transporter with duplicated ATPase domains